MNPLVSCAVAGSTLAALASAQALEPGYQASARDLPLRSGNVLVLDDLDAFVAFDGTRLVLDTPGGPRTLLSLAAPSFGAFTLRTDRDHVLFADGLSGELWLVDLVQGGGRVLATLAFPYDAILWRPGLALISAKTGGFASPDNELVALALDDGRSDLIARLPGSSGPLVRDGDGVLYATASLAFPAPPGSVDLLFFGDAQLVGALGPTHLGAADAQLVHRGLDAASDLAVDRDGDVFFIDWRNGTVGELSRHPRLSPRVSTLVRYAASGPSAAGLQFTSENLGPAAFEPYQPAADHALFVHESDFASGASRLRRIAPQRASLELRPANPVPAGPFALELRGAAAGGFAVIAFGLNPTQREQRLPLEGFEQPLFWDESFFRAIESILVPLDAQGHARVDLVNPGFGVNLPFGAQAAFLDPRDPILGTTAAIAINLR